MNYKSWYCFTFSIEEMSWTVFYIFYHIRILITKLIKKRLLIND